MGHKFDIFDLFTISPSEVEELFFRELNKKNPDYDNIEIFLQSGFVDANTKGKYGEPILYWCVEWNNLKLLKYFLERGSNINEADKTGCTPLIWAARYNHPEIAKYLLENGADPNLLDSDRMSALHWICFRDNHIEMIRLLLENGADPNIKDRWGETPMHNSSKSNSLQNIELLLQYGGELDIRNNKGDLPIDVAVNPNIREYLSEHGGGM